MPGCGLERNESPLRLAESGPIVLSATSAIRMTDLEKVVRRRGLVPFQHYKRRIVVFISLCQWEADAKGREKARKKKARR